MSDFALPPNASRLNGKAGTQQNLSRRSGQVLVAGFSAAVFGSAFLLFAVEPMVSRMVLPALGGSPSVWNTCVLFFQIVLLFGYGYAELLCKRLPLRQQVLLHGAVLASALSLLPLSIGGGMSGSAMPAPLWLLGRLTARIGLPFLAISATAPLLQSWFSRSTHRWAGDPYFLYAASNTGSLLALLSYPVLIETTLGLTQQRTFWALGYVIMALWVMGCGIFVVGHEAGEPAGGTQLAAPPAPLRANRQLRWVGLAFLPSALMLALTTHLASDVASAPLFWVVPLAIYIATFMIAFGRQPRQTPAWLLHLQAATLVGAAAMTLLGAPDIALLSLSLVLALLAFGTTALVCHLELARQRPDVAHLTRYFLLISVGGALGGVLNGLLAPYIFNGPWEYPLLLLAASVFRPKIPREAEPVSPRPRKPSVLKKLRPAILLGAGLALLWSGSSFAPTWLRPAGQILRIVLPAAAMLWALRGGAPLGVGMAGLLVLPLIVKAHGAELMTRSFFGTYRIFTMPDEHLVVMEHGTTIHGMQSTLPGEEARPLAYYYRTGVFGRGLALMQKRMPAEAAIGVLGLGVGTLGCLARPREHWVFYEIDPAVVRLAMDDRYFHYMRRCGHRPEVVLGDARITLGMEHDRRYDLLILDVFNSNSVPMHLMTREALDLYFAHLKPGGVVFYHVSNRYLDLTPVVARLAVSAGAPVRHLDLPAPDARSTREMASELIAVGKPGGSLADFAADGWDVPAAGAALWTDDKSDIYRVIRWQ